MLTDFALSNVGPRKFLKWIALAGLLAFFSLPCFAQVATTGKITGTVTDSSGAAIPGAAVTVKSPALMVPRTMKTQADGSYLFDLLPPGTYEVSVTQTGFKTYLSGDVTINAGFTATVNPQLEVGQVQQTVTVTGAAPVVDVKSTETATTFDERLLQNIPSGRDPWSLVAQAPGVTSSTFDVGGNQSYQQSTMQVHGSTPGEQVFSFNGLELNWPGANNGYTQFYTNHDSFQEFQVVTDNAPAAVPIGGIYMNMVTRSGSNQLHGFAAAYYATGALQASPSLPIFDGTPVNAASPIVMDRDTTVGAGGPLIKNRWWLFGSYRRYDIRSDILAVRTQSGQPVVDVNHQTNTDLRSDWQIGSRNRLSFIWLYNSQNRFFRRDTAYSFVSQQASWLQIEPAYVLQGLWTSQVTNNFLVDFRFGYNHIIFPLSYQPQVTANDYTIQDVTLSTETGAAPLEFVNPAWVTRFAVDGSWFKAGLAGAHNFKFGFERGVSVNQYQYRVLNGINAQYSNGAPLDIIAYNTPVNIDDRFNDAALYAQDSWTIRRRLTLDLGLRYEHWVTYWPKQDILPATFSQIFPRTPVPASGSIVDWNNVSPRLGAALDVTGRGRSVLRVSYGRFYLLEGTQLAESVNPNGLSGQGYLWNGALDSNGIPLTSSWMQPGNLIFAFGGVFTSLNRNMSRPYSDEYSAGYQQQVWGNLSLGVTYYFRTKGNMIGQTNLAATPADYTPITTLNGQPIVNGVTGQPMTLYNLNSSSVGQFNYIITNIPALDNNRYDGLEFTGQKQMSKRWMLLAGFTVQRQKGTYGIGGDQALGDNFNDPNLNINRANNYLNMDSTYVFKVDSTYQLPWNFATSVNFQHYTGYPLQPTEVFSGLNQGSETVILQPAGTLRLPSVNLLDLRISREFTFADRFKLEPLIDLFNLTNSQTIVSQVATFGPAYLAPTNLINPFLARIGLRFTF